MRKFIVHSSFFIIVALLFGCSEMTPELDSSELLRSGKNIAEAHGESFDVSDPRGAFVLNEGNLGSSNGGSLHYITPEGKLIRNIFRTANPGLSLGKITQDLKTSNGRGYILAQNDSRSRKYIWGEGIKSAGRIVVFDLKSMELLEGHESKMKLFDDPTTHFAPFPNGEMIIRSSTLSSNVSRFNPYDVTAYKYPLVHRGMLIKDIPMVTISDTQIFGVSKRELYLFSQVGLEPAYVEKIVKDNNEEITGLAKSGNGEVWIATQDNDAGKSRIYRFLGGNSLTLLDHQEITEGELPSLMNHSSIAAKGDTIYYNNGTKIYRHIYSRQKSELMVDARMYVSYENPIVYGAVKVHPLTGIVYLNILHSYGGWKENTLLLFDFSKPGKEVLTKRFDNVTDFPAGVFFVE